MQTLVCEAAQGAEGEHHETRNRCRKGQTETEGDSDLKECVNTLWYIELEQELMHSTSDEQKYVPRALSIPSVHNFVHPRWSVLR